MSELRFGTETCQMLSQLTQETLDNNTLTVDNTGPCPATRAAAIIKSSEPTHNDVSRADQKFKLRDHETKIGLTLIRQE